MAPSWFKLVLVAFLIVALFGRGKISEVMGDLAKGIKSFKRGMSDDDEVADADRKAIEDRAVKVDARVPAPQSARTA